MALQVASTLPNCSHGSSPMARSTLTGIQQVDALRWLLDTEPVQVYAVGTGGCGADLNSYTTLALT